MAYAAAARADRANDQYLQHYALLRQIVRARELLESEDDLRQWGYLARAVHTFYVNEGLHSQALQLGRQIHSRLNDRSSAILLAETALAMNKNAEAAETLGHLDAEQDTASTQALRGVALARMGNVDEARHVADALSLADKAGPRTLYSAARLYALTGNSPKALKALVRCLESAPPSLIVGYRTHARRCPDFASIASTAEFAAALATLSKVPESGCSGGSKCAGCPMRGKCAHGKSQ